MKSLVLAAAAALLFSGCAGLAQNRLRDDVATATGCQNVRILKWSPDIARVDACGAVKVCYYKSERGDRVEQASGIGGHWECSAG